MNSVQPQNENFLRDTPSAHRCATGPVYSTPKRQVGYVRLGIGTRRGPGSLYWGAWLSVISTRSCHPLSGNVMHGGAVNLIGRAS
jgi:hypothetical protein